MNVADDLAQAYAQGYADGLADKNEWISVKEKLPKNMKDVLVWTKYSSTVVCFFDKNEGVWIYSNGVYEKDDVTHWKPISPPSKGE